MEGYCLTTSVFPRCPDRQKQAQIPLGLVVGPIPQISIEPGRLPKCEVCGAFLFPDDQSAKLCQFCGNVCLDTSPLPKTSLCEFVEPAPHRTKTIVLIDGSTCSKCSNFFKTIVETLPSCFPEQFNTFAVGCFTNDVVLLGPNGRLLCYPDLSDCVIPELAFHMSVPTSLNGLLIYSSLKRADLFSALKFSERAVGPYGRVILILGSPPQGFVRVEPSLELLEPFSGNMTQDLADIVKSFKYKGISLDILANTPTSNSMDMIALTNLVSPLSGQIFMTDETAQSKLSEILSMLFLCRPVSVFLRLPKNFESPNCVKERFCNSLLLSMNSSNSEYIPLFMKEIGDIEAPIQCVVKYTGIDQLLHIQVISFRIPCSDDLALVFSSANSGAFLKAISRQLIDRWRMKHEDIKQLVIYSYTLFSPFLKGYNTYILHSPDLVIPPSLVNLPATVLGCLKSLVFGYGSFMSERYYFMHRMYHMPINELRIACYPPLYDVSGYVSRVSNVVVPVSPTKQSLRIDGIFLLDDGFYNWIWVGRGVNESLCGEIFESDDFDTLVEFHPNESAASKAFWELIHRPVKLCVHNSVGHHSFTLRLVEDSIPGLPSLSKYVAGIAKTIRDEI